MSEPQWQTNLYTAILHATEPRILMLPKENAWVLPHVAVERRVWLSDVTQVIRAMQQIGIDVIVLRCLSARMDKERTRADAIYTAELRAGARVLPDGARWIDRAELAQVPLALPEQRPVLDECLREEGTGEMPARREPWAQRGWFAQAEQWIRAQLTRAGHKIIAPVEQAKSWGISCLLRVPTEAGHFYFKAIPPMSPPGSALPLLFANEPALTRALAYVYEDNIPMPLAIDEERRWMLLADFGPSLRDEKNIGVWEAVVRMFAQMQIESTARVEELLAIGCLDRRLDKLAAQVDVLMNSGEALAGLEVGERKQLQGYAPFLQALCEKLSHYRVPASLVHGDFHPGNIARRGDTFIFFDWTDACVAHPFLDPIPFAEELEYVPHAPETWTRLRDAYLKPWTGYEPMAKLQEAFAVAEVLGALHQVISYWHIAANLEPSERPEMESGLVFWMRMVLKLVTALST